MLLSSVWRSAAVMDASMRARYVRYRAPTWGLWSAAILALGFLYTPVVIIVVQSFNASPVLSMPITQWTVDWYARAAQDADIVAAAKNSLLVAALSIGVALLFGIPAAFGIDRFRFRAKRFLVGALYIPFLLPGVIMGIALVTVFLYTNTALSLKTVMVGHITLLTPVTIILMSASLARWDRDLEEAAMDLGANEMRTFLYVIVPNLRSTVAGIILLGFTFSLDEVTRTFFLVGDQNTLPMAIWAMLKRGITPEVNAVAVAILAIAIVAIGLWTRLSKDLV